MDGMCVSNTNQLFAKMMEIRMQRQRRKGRAFSDPESRIESPFTLCAMLQKDNSNRNESSASANLHIYWSETGRFRFRFRVPLASVTTSWSRGEMQIIMPDLLHPPSCTIIIILYFPLHSRGGKGAHTVL